jgi:hypothetical protein
MLILVSQFFASSADAQFPWPKPSAGAPMHQAPGGGNPGQIVSTTPHPAVARIIVPEKDGQSYGSGTLVDVQGQHGLVVTNWHVVRSASAEITAVFPDGSRSPAQVVKVDRDWDLAALSVWRPTAASPVAVSPLAPKPGEALTIAGYGSGDYRAASGVCTQYLAPSEKHPYELVELAAEARQGDSGGPIFNDRGELAGVLFGSGPGYTSGSYAGRVREFLTGVIPASSLNASSTVASALPGGSLSSGLSAGVGENSQPSSNLNTQPLATTLIGAPPVTNSQPAKLNEVGMGFATPSPLPLAPIAEVPAAPAAPAQAVPLIAESTGRGFDGDPPLTPVHADDTRGTRKWADEEESNPRTAVIVERGDSRGALAASDDDMDRGALRELKHRGLEDARPIEDELNERSSAAAGRIAMVPHSPLPPRQGVTPAEIGDAPADQLLSAAWKRIAGTTVLDQAKTVFAIVGILTLLVQFWRFNSSPEPGPEPD